MQYRVRLADRATGVTVSYLEVDAADVERVRSMYEGDLAPAEWALEVTVEAIGVEPRALTHEDDDELLVFVD